MHDDEVETDATLVTRLVAAQFPEWASLPVEPVASTVTEPVDGIVGSRRRDGFDRERRPLGELRGDEVGD